MGVEELEAEGGVGGREGAEEEGADGLRAVRAKKKETKEVCVCVSARRCVKCAAAVL